MFISSLSLSLIEYKCFMYALDLIFITNTIDISSPISLIFFDNQQRNEIVNDRFNYTEINLSE